MRGLDVVPFIALSLAPNTAWIVPKYFLNKWIFPFMLPGPVLGASLFVPSHQHVGGVGLSPQPSCCCCKVTHFGFVRPWGAEWSCLLSCLFCRSFVHVLELSAGANKEAALINQDVWERAWESCKKKAGRQRESRPATFLVIAQFALRWLLAEHGP